MNLKEQNLTFLLMKTLADMVKVETDEARAELMTVLLAQYDETGTKAFSVQIPGAEKVATFTISEPKPAVKVQDAALLAWCRENRPELVEKVEHPAVEAWTEERLTTAAVDTVAADCMLTGTSFVTGDGELVDGIEYVPAGRPKSYTVRYEKGGQDRVIAAWRNGELAGIEPGKNLPIIGEAA